MCDYPDSDRAARAFPEEAILRASDCLSGALEAGVPPEDYAEAAEVFVSELVRYGWAVSPPAHEVHVATTTGKLEYLRRTPLAGRGAHRQRD